MKTYELPKITIKNFVAEEILTTSATDPIEPEAKGALAKAREASLADGAKALLEFTF